MSLTDPTTGTTGDPTDPTTGTTGDPTDPAATTTSPVPVDTAQPDSKPSDGPTDGAEAPPASFPVGELVGRRNEDSGELEAVGVVIEEVPIEVNPQTGETKTAYRVAWLPLDPAAGLIFADGHEAIR